MIVAGNCIYDTCPICGKLVKLNKFIFGALHICLSDEEVTERRKHAAAAIQNQLAATSYAGGLGLLKGQPR